MHDITHASDLILLEILVGKVKAQKLNGKPLSDIFGLTRTRGTEVVKETTHVYMVDKKLAAANELMKRCLAENALEQDALKSPNAVRDFLRLKIGPLEHEVFCAVFLDTQHRPIAIEEMFRGTLGQASVYPREIVKRALAHNAAALILAHNHPSGSAVASTADQNLTTALKSALALVDVRVLDHFIVTTNTVLSFAERGLI